MLERQGSDDRYDETDHWAFKYKLGHGKYAKKEEPVVNPNPRSWADWRNVIFNREKAEA